MPETSFENYIFERAHFHKGADYLSSTMQFGSINFAQEMAHALQKCAIWISITTTWRRKKMQGVATGPFNA